MRINSVVPLCTPNSLALDLHPTFPSPIVFNGNHCLPSQYESQVQWLRNCHLPCLLFEDHLSRVSGPGKLFFSNILFYLLILSIVCPEPSSQSHLSKPYDCPSPAPSPSSSSTFLHQIMPKPILAWERALVSSKLPSFSVKQKQEMKIVSKTIFPPPDLLLTGDSTITLQPSTIGFSPGRVFSGCSPGLPFSLPPSPLSSGRSPFILALQTATWDRSKVKKGFSSRG